MSGKFTKAADVFSLGISMLELASDLALPTNGRLWHELRDGIFPINVIESTYIRSLNVKRLQNNKI